VRHCQSVSQENLEIAKRALAAVTAGPDPDYATVNRLYSRDHVFVPIGVAGGIEEVAEGVEGYQAWSEGLQELFVNARHEVHGAVDVGPDKVLAVSTTHYEARASGVASQQRIWSVMTLRSGSIVRTEAFTDPAKALEAAGVAN
jgi:ketosteroid isomerase-like protein